MSQLPPSYQTGLREVAKQVQRTRKDHLMGESSIPP